MGKIKAFFVLSVCLFQGILSVAQTDTSSNMSYVINTIYAPKLSSANKVLTLPSIQPIESNKPEFTYSLPNFGYAVRPTYYPAKAISIKSELDKPLFGNYFKLGAGNYLTPFAEVRVHSVRNKKYNYGVYGKHLSANAGKPENADFSDNALGVVGSKYGSKGDLTGRLNFERHAVHYYGYDHDSFSFEKKDIKQIFNEFNGHVAYDRGYNTKKLGSKSLFEFYTFGTHGNRRENDFIGEFDLRYKLPKKKYIDLNAGVEYTNIIDSSSPAYARTFVRINPSYTFNYKKIDIKVGANAIVALDSANTNTFRLFPDLSVEHFVVPKKVLAFAEINGDVKSNTLKQLSYINPFIGNDVRVANTINNFNAAGGIKGVLIKKLDYILKVRFSADNDMPLFITDSVPTRAFDIVYDNVQTVAFQAGLGFRLDERFFIQASSTFYNYKTDVQAEAWQLPSFDADVNLRYTIAKKLNLRVQLYGYGQRMQQDMFSEDKLIQTLTPFMDVNVMADYRYKKNISFFLNANNISNSRYQKWYAYPSFGLNLLAGITFSL